MKRPVSKPSPKKNEEKESEKDRRSWWARPDEELVKERAEKIKDWYDSSKIKIDEDDRDQVIQEAVKRDPRIQNLLDKVVVRERELQRKGDYLIIPLYSTDRGEKIARKLRLKTVRRIKLDDYGWGVWELIDGRRNVRSMGRLLSNRFGKEIEPLYPRLAKFLAYLQNLRLIRITDKGK
jgi:hypothetical protein